MAAFQEAILMHLPSEVHPRGPRAVSDEVLVPDAAALRDDLDHALTLVTDPRDKATLGYVVQFLGGVAESANDADLTAAVRALAEAIGCDRAAAAAADLRATLRRRLADPALV